MARTTTTKTRAKKTADTLQKAIDEMSIMAREAKRHYDTMDPTTKKKVASGIAGAAALVALALGTAAARTGRRK